VFDKASAVIKDVIPIHKELQDKDRSRSSPRRMPIRFCRSFTTPTSKRSAIQARIMPLRFSYPNDAIAHLSKSVEVYKSHYGRDPRGLWPAKALWRKRSSSWWPMRAISGWRPAKSCGQESGMDSFTRDSADTVKKPMRCIVLWGRR